MADVSKLLSRIDAEFDSLKERVHKFQEQKVTEYKGRQDRFEQFASVCEQLRKVWEPRLDALVQRFGDKVSVKPDLQPARRAATFSFKSPVAHVVLTFSASTDTDVRKLVLNYDLDILPILMRFERHSALEMPLDKVDPEAVAQWIEDRIIDFVKTYAAVHENQYYLKDYLVEDPIAKVQFPKYAAAATLERQGKTYYFISDETRREFEQK
jgi:YHS domain-containing protein